MAKEMNIKLCPFDDFEYEDDVVYDEIQRRVMRLILEDEEDGEESCESERANTVQKHGLNYDNSSCYVAQPDGWRYDWLGGGKKDHMSMSNLWKPASGTGVFIPQMVKTRRRNRPRKKNKETGSVYKRAEQLN